MDKYCSDSVGNDLCFMLFDDYLYVVDIVLWLVDGQVCLCGGVLKIILQGEMFYVEYQFSLFWLQVIISMYCCVGSQCEWVQVVMDGGLYVVSEMCEWQEECGYGVVQCLVVGW